MIDKDQVGAMLLIIKEVYSPVILRSVVNLVLLDISQIVAGARCNTKNDIDKILHTDACQKALIDALMHEHWARCPDVIMEILKQYGLMARKDEHDFYLQHMGKVFDGHVSYVKTLLLEYNYDALYGISKMAVT